MNTTTILSRPSLKRVGFFVAAAGVVLLLLGRASAGAALARPNLVFIITDQQRSDDLGCAGNPYVKTPALDSLAARGVRFTKVPYCTFALCTPSRASQVTSRMPYEIGVNNNRLKLPDGLPSMGTVFRQAGYRTVWCGKWHLPEAYPTQPDEIPGFENPVEPQGPAGRGKKAAARGGEGGDSEEGGANGAVQDPHAMAAALRFLKARPQQPFLLVVSYLNPHDVCSFTEKTPQKFNLPADPSKLPPLPANLNAPDLGNSSRNSRVEWSDLSWRQQLYYYYRLTERVDHLIGAVLDAVREAGLEQNTLVLFTSDHGEMGGAHHRIRKTSFYEEAMAVPFLLAGPGVPRGKTDQTHLVSGLDILPTFCDFAGIAPPPQARGFSVKKILDDPAAPWREAVFGSLGEAGGRMACTGRFKYNLYPGNKEELLDLQADPGEMKNLAGDPALAATLAVHRNLLHDWMEQTDDPFGKAGNESGSGGAGKKKRGKK